jgi:hypothetical protein
MREKEKEKKKKKKKKWNIWKKTKRETNITAGVEMKKYNKKEKKKRS